MEELLWKHGRDILTSPGMERERSIPQHGYVNCFDHSVRRTGCTVFVMAGWRWRMRSGILDSTRWRRILSGGICFR